MNTKFSDLTLIGKILLLPTLPVVGAIAFFGPPLVNKLFPGVDFKLMAFALMPVGLGAAALFFALSVGLLRVLGLRVLRPSVPQAVSDSGSDSGTRSVWAPIAVRPMPASPQAPEATTNEVRGLPNTKLADLTLSGKLLLVPTVVAAGAAAYLMPMGIKVYSAIGAGVLFFTLSSGMLRLSGLRLLQSDPLTARDTERPRQRPIAFVIVGVLAVLATVALAVAALVTQKGGNAQDATKQTREPLLLKGHSKMVAAVTFRSDGRQIATGSSDQTVRVWDPANGKLLRRIDHFPGSITDLTFTPDGGRLVTSAYDSQGRKAGQWAGLVQVWDATTGKEIRAIPLEGTQEAVCVTPDGKRVLAGGSDRVLRVWDLKSGNEVFALVGHTAGIRSLAVSSDGVLIASGADDGSVRLWDSATGKKKATLQHSAERPLAVSVVFTRDGKFLVSAGADGVARLWDVGEGKVVHKAEGHRGPIHGLAMKPDGTTFATASGLDLSIRLWDRKSCTEVRRINLMEGSAPYRATFSPDGTRLAVACFDGIARLYDVAVDSK